MKKIFIISLLSLFLLTGCGNEMSPTGAVEKFLSKYQKMDSEVLAQLDKVVSEDSDMSDDQKKEYKTLMERQYQNLNYKIVNEEIDEDRATVDVEIEVFDYASSIRKSEEYYNENRDMFEEVSHEDNVDREDGNIIEASSKYIDYKIEQMKNVSDKIKYTLIFELEKEDNEWKVLEISDIDRKKLHGLFYE